MISVDPDEKWSCFLATPEVDIDENCAKKSLCLIKKENSLDIPESPCIDTNDASVTTSLHFILLIMSFLLINNL